MIFLQIAKRRIVERLYNDAEIQAKYQKLVEDRKKAREEAKIKKHNDWVEDQAKKKAEQGENYVEEPEPEDEPEDTSDAPDLAKMQQDAKDVLNNRYDSDLQALEELVKQIGDKRITMINISGDGSVENTQKKIKFALKNYLEERLHMYERAQAFKIEPPEVPFNEKSYVVKRSKFGRYSPISLKYCRNNDFSVIYRDKLYYTISQEERDEFLSKPEKYAQAETVPLEIPYKTSCIVLGPPKSGKSELCKKLSISEGLTYLKISLIVKDFSEMDSVLGKLLQNLLQTGKELPDELMISLLQKRLAMRDCVENGWILEGFPKTLKQARLLVENGISPDLIFSVTLSKEEKLQRIQPKANKYIFGLDPRVMTIRMKNYESEIGRIEAFFALQNDNVRKIDAKRSVWYMEDFVRLQIHNLTKIKQTTAQNRQKKMPCPVYLLQVPKQKVSQNLTKWFTYCPVCYRQEKKHTKAKHNLENILEMQGKFYYSCSANHAQLLMESFKNFVNAPNNIWETAALKVKLPIAASEPMSTVLDGYCAVSLVEARKLEKGCLLALCKYNNLIYSMANHLLTNKFLETPSKYENAKLPAKLPTQKEKIDLAALAASPNSIPFLEETLGQLLTNGLLEIANNRHKYPTLSVQETGLKLLALYLKANNPNNTAYMAKKYKEKMRKFIEDCEMPTRIYHESMRKAQAYKKGIKWEEYEENALNELGEKYDEMVKQAEKEKANGFATYFE